MSEQPSVYHRQKNPIILCALHSAALHAAPQSTQASEHTRTFMGLRAVFESPKVQLTGYLQSRQQHEMELELVISEDARH